MTKILARSNRLREIRPFLLRPVVVCKSSPSAGPQEPKTPDFASLDQALVASSRANSLIKMVSLAACARLVDLVAH
jgi:hypothetical protein